MAAASGWIRVANGFRLVASAGSALVLQEGGRVTGSLARHGIDLANNTNTAAKAAGVALSIPPPKMISLVAPNRVGDHEDIKMEIGSSEEKHKKPHDSSSTNTLKSPTTSSQDDDENISKMSHPEVEESRFSTTGETVSKTKSINRFEGEHTLIQEGMEVPSTRIGRAAGFASLGVGLALGTVVEAASRVASTVTGNGSSMTGSSMVMNDANADRLAATLCRMRGASLKMGQMLSMNDETILPPPLSRALERVKQGADAMPLHQLHGQLKSELGDDWRKKFVSFEELPFAAASIGQVHRATIMHNGEEKQVVVKVQYPGVATSIESDLSNLTMLVKMSGLAPPGLFIDRVITVGRDELKVECDYVREARNQERLRNLVHNDAELAKANFRVPSVIGNLSTTNILTSEYCAGGTIDKVSSLDQVERNRIGRNIMRLTVKELFEWHFMQTDPNFGNFLYDVGTETTALIDFGSAREYNKSFVDGYIRIVWACANQDVETLMAQSHKMGFLTGEENDIMLEAHKLSGFTLGEPFATNDEYDFKDSGITARISEHGSVFLKHRLTPPPEEVYTLHRKLAGAFNVCIRLGARIKCRDLLEDILKDYKFDDGQNHPLESA